MDFRESQEHAAIRQAVSEIGASFGHDYFVECSTKGVFVDELWDTVFGQGFGGVNLPEEYGGGGGGIYEMAIVIEELAAQGCPLIFLIVAGMCGPIINDFGTDAQKARWLPTLASGREKMSFAITESGSGSNAPNLATTARLEGGSWRLSGEKQYITGIDVADAVLVVARTGTGANGRAELGLFIVETDRPGLEYQPIPMEIKEPDRQFSVLLDSVEVPEQSIVGGEPGRGMLQIFSGLNPERINVAAQAVGLGRYFMGKAVAYAKGREVWGQPIGAHQGVSHPLAEAKIGLELSRLMAYKAAWEFDNGEASVGESASVAKLAAADAVLFAFDQAVQVHGGNAFASEYGIADLWGLTRLMRSAPVSREMVLNYVAQHTLGLPRSY
ncbi:acyl-CoA dehydrogenase family protein [Mumia sp. Pv 4-285]|uniref:acyl-CoA dehydrogenase family protein n=1 Tax=Mumia qirimensis TaxID=3234852 RepID=UPI00351D404B